MFSLSFTQALYANYVSKTDSLQKLLNAETEVNIRADLLNELALELAPKDPQRAMIFANQAMDAAESIGQKTIYAQSFKTMGVVHDKLKDYDEAFSDLYKSQNIYAQLNDIKNETVVKNYLADLYKRIHNYSMSASIYEEVCKNYSKIGDNKKLISSLYELGYIYVNYTLEYDKGLSKLMEALELGSKTTNKIYSINILRQIAYVFFVEDNVEASLEYYLKAISLAKSIHFGDQVIEIYAYMGSMMEERGDTAMAMSFYKRILNVEVAVPNPKVQMVLGKYFALTKNYNKSIEYLKAALFEFEKNDNVRWQSHVHSELAYAYMNNNESQKGITQGKIGIQIARENKLKKELYENYLALSEVYASIEDFKESKKYFRLYNEAKDSINSEESKRNVAALRTQLESIKNKNENIELRRQNEVQALEKKHNQTIIYSIIVVLIFVIMLVIVLFKSQYRNARQNKILKNQRNQLFEKNKAITDSINYAKRIQNAVLPHRSFIKQLFPKSFVFYRPKDIVSGDFYWSDRKDGYAFLSVVDCTGHGVPGALMSIIGVNYLNQAVNEKGYVLPSQILNYLNTGVRLATDSGMDEGVSDGMDISLISFDVMNRKMKFAGAYNSLFLVRGKELIEYKSPRFSIGEALPAEQNRFYDQEVEVQEGDSLYLFSDGIVDQFDASGSKKFKTAQFKNFLISVTAKDMDAQRADLKKVFYDWMGEGEQTDDVCVVGIRI